MRALEALEKFTNGGRHRDRRELFTLTEDHHGPVVPIDGRPFKFDAFRQPAAGRQSEAYNCVILCLEGGEESRLLICLEFADAFLRFFQPMLLPCDRLISSAQTSRARSNTLRNGSVTERLTRAGLTSFDGFT